MAKSDSSSYFRRSSLFWIVTVTLSMGYYTWAVFWPQQLPYDILGPLGALTKYLVKEYHSFMYTGWWLAWAVHLCEALVALKVCRTQYISKLNVNLKLEQVLFKLSATRRQWSATLSSGVPAFSHHCNS
ncbi:transmembrane protein 254 isoform X2 [Ictalurus punctatus]|uniref:Transmembrane protein 254 n=1 Tax=Ictalurus punctatus TaxID=7998 RepID=A0A9F7RFK5_ICTPU|nr:transmembrane protein 254 isoform X2 [Ictalurus punctatus]